MRVGLHSVGFKSRAVAGIFRNCPATAMGWSIPAESGRCIWRRKKEYLSYESFETMLIAPLSFRTKFASACDTFDSTSRTRKLRNLFRSLQARRISLGKRKHCERASLMLGLATFNVSHDQLPGSRRHLERYKRNAKRIRKEEVREAGRRLH